MRFERTGYRSLAANAVDLSRHCLRQCHPPHIAASALQPQRGGQGTDFFYLIYFYPFTQMEVNDWKGWEMI